MTFDITQEYRPLGESISDFYDAAVLKIKNRQETVSHGMSMGLEKLIREAHIPLAAVCEPDDVKYAPGQQFPAFLRIGTLAGKHTPTNISYLHICGEHKALAFRGFEAGQANIFLQNACLRLLASIPSHLLKIHLVDPRGLGKAFADLSELSPLIKGRKILTESSEIDRLLVEVKESAVSIVQGRLTNRYASLREYNAAAGEKLAEPYRLICVANYPLSFSRQALETFASLLATGRQSGVMALFSVDEEALRETKAAKLPLADPKNVFIVTPPEQGDLRRDGHSSPLDVLNRFSASLDDAPLAAAPDIVAAANENIAKHSRKTVELNELFTQNPHTENTAAGLSIPLGIVGKDRQCLLRLGVDATVQHVLVGGTTGSGKTVLLHNIITNGAWLYAPDELELYLLDYKEGTEFSVYRDLPHVRILSMASSREFGLCALEHLKQELESRGVLFTKNEVSNLAKYREKTGEKMPRILFVIDEFQVLLSGQDKISREAASIIDDMSDRARIFGIHLILSTQTLVDSNINASTLSNIAVRIGFRMSETDCAKLFHRDNMAASTLKVAGEGYYNEEHGQSEGNIRFKAANLTREMVCDTLARLPAAPPDEKLRYIFDGQHYLPFKNSRLESYLADMPARATPGQYTDLLVGEPGYIAPDLFKIRLRKQIGGNILMVGDAEGDAVSLAMLLGHQLCRAGYSLAVLNLLPVDSLWREYLDALQTESGSVRHYKPSQAGELLDFAQSRLPAQAKKASLFSGLNMGESEPPPDWIKLGGGEPFNTRGAQNAPPVSLPDPEDHGEADLALIVLNAASSRVFGNSPQSPMVQRLLDITARGPEFGVHVIAYCPNVAGFNTILGRGCLPSFETLLLLRGGNSHKLPSVPLSAPVAAEGQAYVLAPGTRYEADPLRLFDPDGICGGLS